ncbi:SapC family protein [Roseibium sp.]|uniref:SapC family protein n=1 Tax=Roseibium sp. TaxID=1936156 RepID=UPI003A97B66C
MSLGNNEPAELFGGTHDRPPPTPSLPPLFHSASILNAKDHGGLRQKPVRAYAHAASMRAAPLNAVEFQRAALRYPIVFSGQNDRLSAHAILGLHHDTNLFVETDGTWQPECYIPAYIRRYPFILARSPSATQFTLCADLKSGFFSANEGDALFEEGKPGLPLQKALQFCTAYQREAAASTALISKLVEHDIFTTKEGKFTLGTGERILVPEFKVIDDNKLNGLSDAAFCDLRKAGCLPAVYSHLMSLNNWTVLLERTDRAAT